MNRSLALKLLLSFLVVGLAGTAVLAALAATATRGEFAQFMLGLRRDSLAAELASYYAENQTWDGVPAPFSRHGAFLPRRMRAAGAFSQDPAETAFVNRVNQLLGLGALVGTGTAVVLGAILVRSLTRPLKELTEGARAVAAGQIETQVPVRSSDEMGQDPASDWRSPSRWSRRMGVASGPSAPTATGQPWSLNCQLHRTQSFTSRIGTATHRKEHPAR